MLTNRDTDEKHFIRRTSFRRVNKTFIEVSSFILEHMDEIEELNKF